MTYDFPYLRWKGRHFPLVFLTVSVGERGLSTYALVDAGATTSLFRREVAEHLGLNIREGKPMTLTGAFAHEATVYLHKLNLVVAGKQFEAEIGFWTGYRGRFNLIGRQDFFQEFQVTYDDKARRLRLET